MSQAKVDKYKKDKANRKKIMAKQKRQAFLRSSILILVVIAFVGFFGYSVYKEYIYKEPVKTEEPTTYVLSEEEVSSVWAATENEDETTTTADGSENEEETTTPAESEASTDETEAE